VSTTARLRPARPARRAAAAAGTAPPRLACSVAVPGFALPPVLAAFEAECEAVDYFIAGADATASLPETKRDLDATLWQVRGLRHEAPPEGFALALAIAAAAAGIAVPALAVEPVPVADWLARTRRAFPAQPIGRRFWVHGTHERAPAPAGRIALAVDAGLAFGSGEHATTRGCLMAFEHVARRRPRPRRLLDLGCGSGILALAATKLLRRPVLASDIDAAAVATTRANARLNGVPGLVRALRADGWRAPALVRAAPYDLVFANILARPLAAMAATTARRLAPGGVAILSGLLAPQGRMVLAAHRRHGLALASATDIGAWRTLVLRRPAR